MIRLLVSWNFAKAWSSIITLGLTVVIPDSSYAGTKIILDRPLFTYKIGDFGTMFVTEQSCPAPISKVESHTSDKFCATMWCSIKIRVRILLANCFW